MSKCFKCFYLVHTNRFGLTVSAERIVATQTVYCFGIIASSPRSLLAKCKHRRVFQVNCANSTGLRMLSRRKSIWSDFGMDFTNISLDKPELFPYFCIYAFLTKTDICGTSFNWNRGQKRRFFLCDILKLVVKHNILSAFASVQRYKLLWCGLEKENCSQVREEVIM